MSPDPAVLPPDALTRVQIPVEGMTCAACQVRVQRALTRVPGVADASVNLLAHQASVRYDAARVRPEELVAAWLPSRRRAIARMRWSIGTCAARPS